MFLLQRGVRGRRSAVISGARMSVLRGERRGESCGSGVGLSSAPARGAIGAVITGVADSQEIGRAFGLEGPWYDLRQEHHQGS